jgi:hypothetical protein
MAACSAATLKPVAVRVTRKAEDMVCDGREKEEERAADG